MARKKVRGAQKSIYRRNLIFYMIQPYVRLIFYQFYGKVEFKGRENIPLGEPVIFAPNHQNALSDPMAIILHTTFQPVWLGRADAAPQLRHGG